jgi:NAD(P)-dependent dehydrogenase (short-subunit alcohol dehydrogenase family)
MADILNPCKRKIMRLQNKIAVVTGGATGIGAATALMYAREGATVVIADVNEADGRATVQSIEAEGGTAQFVWTDVSQEADVAAMIEAVEENFGRLDVLVTCAGILLGAAVRIDQFDAEAWDKVITVNLRGTFLCTKHAVPLMEKSGGGVVVLIASGAGVTGPSASVAYGASKGGVRGLGFTLKHQVESLNIRVHVVCPGNLNTPLKLRAIADIAERAGESPEAAVAAARSTLSKPEEVAKVLTDLASDAGANAEELVFTK